MNREVLDKWCERGILALVLAILVFAPLATGAVRMLEFLIVQGLTLGVMLLWGVRLWVNPRPQLLWTPLCWGVLAFAVYAIGRYATADIEYVARQELIRILVYTFLFFAILNNLYRQESTQVIIYTMVGLAILISGYAIYQYLTGSDRVWHFIKPALYKGRAGGTFISPNNLAGFLELILPLALTSALVARGKTLMRIVLGYGGLIILAGMAATVSRGGWISCGISLVVLFGLLAMHQNYRLPALVLLTLLLAGSLFFFVKMDPMGKRFAGNPTSDPLVVNDSVIRYEMWDAAIRMWQDHFWFGVGPAHYDYQFHRYRPLAVQARPDRAHNDYLNTLADWGTVGGVLVATALGLMITGVVTTWRRVRRSEVGFGDTYSNKFAFVLGASCSLLALLVHSVVDFNMQVPANALLAIALMALLSSHLRFTTDRYWKNAGTGLKSLASVGLVLGLGYLGWQEVRRTGEYFWLNRAQSTYIYSTNQAETLAKAFAAEPRNPDTSYQIGECYRVQSFEGGDNFAELAQKAMEWYAIGIRLNPLDSYNYMRYGMCLDWTEHHADAESYFNQADALDPNSYFVAENVGWHYVQARNFAAAKTWFLRSLELYGLDNDMAKSYVQVVEQKLLDTASNTNEIRLP